METDPKIPNLAASFVYIHANEYKSSVNRDNTVDEHAICDCSGQDGQMCGESSNCINRLLFIECLDHCPMQDRCLNRQFQSRMYSKVVVAKTPGKGYGLVAGEDIAAGQFVIEYVGEVINHKSFLQRLDKYNKTGVSHYYFMALGPDRIIDATVKGNVARFVNHSCSPNCGTQKWIVDRQTRIGIFSLRNIPKGAELGFDYKFEGLGTRLQKCLCGEVGCKGTIGSISSSKRSFGISHPRMMPDVARRLARKNAKRSDLLGDRFIGKPCRSRGAAKGVGISA